MINLTLDFQGAKPKQTRQNVNWTSQLQSVYMANMYIRLCLQCFLCVDFKSKTNEVQKF